MTINNKKRRLIKNTAELSVSNAQAVQKMDLVMATLIRILNKKQLVTEEEFIAEFDLLYKGDTNGHDIQKETTGEDSV